MKRVKKAINNALKPLGYGIRKLEQSVDIAVPSTGNSIVMSEIPESVSAKPNPKDYSTTDEPMEVPCQKVAYYHALKNYIKPSSKVLDVGSGLGYGMAIMSVLAKEVRGIDVDTKAVKYAKTEYIGNNPKIKSVQTYNGYRTPFQDNEFDVVTCIDVLEHVKDYHKFLDELLRISKDYVLISTPNQRPEFTNADGTPKNYWHLREWKYGELDEILKQHKATIDWFFIDGPFEGPFTLQKRATKNTLVLMPVLRKGR